VAGNGRDGELAGAATNGDEAALEEAGLVEDADRALSGGTIPGPRTCSRVEMICWAAPEHI